VFVSVGLALYHSILVEVALANVFTSLVSGFQITIPLAGIGAISLAFVNHWMNSPDRKMKLAEK